MNPDELRRHLAVMEEQLCLLDLRSREQRAHLLALTELLAFSLQSHHKEDRFDLHEFFSQKLADARNAVDTETESQLATVRAALAAVHGRPENQSGSFFS